MTITRGLTILALIVDATAPTSLWAQQSIPIRRVAVVASSDSGVISRVDAIHVLSGGRVLLDDGGRRRLIVFDSTLKWFSIAADTSAGAAANFGEGGIRGAGNGAILPFVGDSVAFVDITARSLTVVDASGHFGRITAPASVGDMFNFNRGPAGVPGFDRRGRLYYRVDPRPKPPEFTDKETTDTAYFHSDSAAVLAADFDARRVDTVAKLHAVQRMKVVRTVRTGPQGPIMGMAFYYIVDPLPNVDEWAYLADGTVAIARGHDYHIDWILPDGRRESGPKMPFDWRRITEDEKHRIVDSVQHRLDSAYEASVSRMIKANPGQSPASLASRVNHPEVIAASELPDYYPPIRAGSQMQADPDGNLWILPTTSLQAKGGYLYDVVNRKGEIIERVQFPEGRALAGFGSNGVVYMLVPPGYSWPRVERASPLGPRPRGGQLVVVEPPAPVIIAVPACKGADWLKPLGALRPAPTVAESLFNHPFTEDAGYRACYSRGVVNDPRWPQIVAKAEQIAASILGR